MPLAPLLSAHLQSPSQATVCLLLSVSYCLGPSLRCLRGTVFDDFGAKGDSQNHNKLHCALGPWQSTSVIMSVTDFIVALAPWHPKQGL